MPENGSYELAKRIVHYSFEKKACDVQLLDLRKISTISDYFIICHGESDVQVKAIANAILDGLKKEGTNIWHKEGYEYLHWVLLDYVDVVVHIFQKETRQFYGLERLWGDAAVQTFTES